MVNRSQDRPANATTTHLVTLRLPYILAYKSTARISRPPKILPQYEEKNSRPAYKSTPFFRYNMEKKLLHATRNNEITPDNLLYQRVLLLKSNLLPLNN